MPDETVNQKPAWLDGIGWARAEVTVPAFFMSESEPITIRIVPISREELMREKNG